MESGIHIGVGVTPSVLDTSFTGLRESIGLIRRTNTSCVRVSTVSNRFITGLALNPGVMRTVQPRAGLPLSYRLVIDAPRGLVPTFTETNTSVVAVRIRTASRVRNTVRVVGGRGVTTNIIVGPKADMRIVGPILNSISVILIVAIGPNFNNRDFVRDALNGVRRLTALHRGRNCRCRVRISNKVARRAVIGYVGTKTSMFMTNSCVCSSRGPSTTVDELGSTYRGTI